MTPHELRVTLDRLDLSAAEAGHLLGVHRATIYRWLDGSMSVSIVVELLLRLNGAAWNPASGGDRVASWSDKRKAAVGPIAGETGKADCPQYTCQVQAGRGVGAAEPAAWRDHCGHDAGGRLAVSHRPRLPRLPGNR